MELGEKIKEVRKSKGMLQAILSQRVGVSMRTLQRFESGERSPDIETLKKIADALEIDILLLQGYEESENGVFSKSFSSLEDALKDEEEVRQVQSGEVPISKRLANAFTQLNETGQEKAVERVEELTEVPKYKK